MNRVPGRKFSFTCCLLSLTAAAQIRADVPRQIHYQGKLRGAAGSPVTDTLSMRFRLYDHATQVGPVLFDETHPAVQVGNGLFSVLIGSESGGVPDSALDAPAIYLGIEIDGSPELAPRPLVASSPYGVKARSAEQLVRPGTFQPAVTVEGSGQIKIPGGDPGDGKVLTSDADGVASWESASGVPGGVIAMWHGAYDNIPSGWQLCDGTSGTPDLRDRFIYSVSSSYNAGSVGDLGTTGGAASHNHEVDPPQATTSQVDGANIRNAASGSILQKTDTHTHTVDIAPFNSASASNLPPYYKLAFIMKL